MLLRRVDPPSRVHLDIGAEARRPEALGTRRVGRVRDWLVMEALGHRFCVVHPQRDGFEEQATHWP